MSKDNDLWQLAPTAVIAALMVHHILTGEPPKAREHLPPLFAESAD